MAKLLATRINLKASSEELTKPGDYCVKTNVPIYNTEVAVRNAIIIKCPFCGMDMMSTHLHKIFFRKKWWEELLFLIPSTGRLNVRPMLQCPGNETHKFLIKDEKVIAL